MANINDWHPHKSVANDGSEEGGRGSFVELGIEHQLGPKRKKTAIPRRRTPTVDVSVLLSHAGTGAKNKQSKGIGKLKARDTYDTIENQEGPSTSILECSSVVYRKKPESNSASENKLCGWRDRELESYRTTGDRSITFSSFDQSRLQAPADGLKSNLQSRARTTPHPSSRGKSRKPYVFQHFNEMQYYIEHYRLFHSYTTLTVPGLRHKMCLCADQAIISEGILPDEIPREPKVVEQDSDGIVQPEVKSYYQEDPYPCLRELVSRLGVSTCTPVQRNLKAIPSLKTKSDEDPVVCSNGNMNKEERLTTTDEPISTGNDSCQQDSPMSARAARKTSGRNKALELPQIAQTIHIPTAAPTTRNTQISSSNSVISVNKYLQVMSPKQQTSLQEESEEEGEKGTGEINTKKSSEDCLPHVHTFATTLSSTPGEIAWESREPLNGCHDAVEFEMHTHISAAMKLAAMQEQLMTLNSSQKKKLLSNKAHSLGLSSRSWVKTPKAKKMFGTHTTHRRVESSDTRLQCESNSDQQSTNFRHSLDSRPHTSMAGNPSRTVSGCKSDQSIITTTSHNHNQSSQGTDIDQYRENSRIRTHGDHIHRKSSAKPDINRRRKDNSKKLDQLRGMCDSSRNNRNATSRCPTRQASRCANARLSRPATSLSTTSRWGYETKRNQHKVGHSTRQRLRRGRAFATDVMDLQLEQQHLDESCCWNEIPRKTDAHIKSNHFGQVQSSKPTDFDLDNIMLRAKHRSESGVAMLTVTLRNHKQTRKSADAAITPGAEHTCTAHVSRRFSGILKVQKPLAPTQMQRD